MTEEQNLPQAQWHEAAPYEASSPQGQPSTSSNSAGQSGEGPSGAGQGRSRRRRRKRKGGKGAGTAQPQDGAAQSGQAPLPQGEQGGGPQSALPFVQANGQASSDGGQPRQQNHQGQPQGQGQGKKRFRKKNRGGSNAARNENPGNQINANPGNGYGGSFGSGSGNGQGNGQGNGRRRNKQRRGPVAFVGPMDHSYRETNGNFADSPPSTIETHRNGNGNGQNYNGYNSAVNGNGNGYASEFSARPRSGQPSAQELADAPTRIVCFIDDLFFTAKIQETARKLGVKVAFVKADKDIVAQLAGDDEETRPALIVFDLNNLNAKPLTLIPKLKAKLKKSTSIVGFLSHLQGDLKMKATEAGCDAVMPRSAFSQNLPNLLRRYGLVDELEGVEQ